MPRSSVSGDWFSTPFWLQLIERPHNWSQNSSTTWNRSMIILFHLDRSRLCPTNDTIYPFISPTNDGRMKDKLKGQEDERNRHFKAISKMFMNYIHQLHNIHKAANAGRSATLWDPTHNKNKAAYCEIRWKFKTEIAGERSNKCLNVPF